MIHKKTYVFVNIIIVVSMLLCTVGITMAKSRDTGILLLKENTYGQQKPCALWYNDTGMYTYGPVTPRLNFSYIRFMGRDPATIKKIQNILQQRILQFIRPLGVALQLNNLSFTVDYPQKLPSLFLYKNFRYGTSISVLNNGNYTTVPHRIIVNGLEGWFALSRGGLVKIRPPMFTFFGHCSSIDIKLY